MYTIDTSSFFHFFQTLWSLATGAMRLDPAAFTAMDTPGTGLLAATILFLAGVSEALGQSVVLLANRVKPGRFVLSLLLTGVLFIVSAFIWGATIWGIATLVSPTHEPFPGVSESGAFSYPPFLVRFFAFI